MPKGGVRPQRYLATRSPSALFHTMLKLTLALALCQSAAGAFLPATKGGDSVVGRRQLLSAAASFTVAGLAAQKAEAATAEIRKASEEAIGVSRVAPLEKAIENRGPELAGKSGQIPAGGLAGGTFGRDPVKLSYGYQGKTSVLGPGGAVGNSGPNGFFAGGEDFGGKFIGKAPNNRVDTVVADASSS